jgi:hypothetical protein
MIIAGRNPAADPPEIFEATKPPTNEPSAYPAARIKYADGGIPATKARILSGSCIISKVGGVITNDIANCESEIVIKAPMIPTTVPPIFRSIGLSPVFFGLVNARFIAEYAEGDKRSLWYADEVE